MYLSYYDESGDDGFPEYSSNLFVLTAVYLHVHEWRDTYRKIQDFRKQLAREYKFPFSEELHTKALLCDKHPYRDLGWTLEERKRILVLFCRLVANLNIRIVNVAINKKIIQKQDYDVLDKALTYSIQRIENDLAPDDNRFMIITDEGRVGKMRKTARRVQRFNPIPSKYSTNSYQKEIGHLIEDPLPKDSKESYFIQIADMVSYLVMLWKGHELGIRSFPNRVSRYITPADVRECLDLIKPSLNLKAAPQEEFGIVCYPRK